MPSFVKQSPDVVQGSCPSQKCDLSFARRWCHSWTSFEGTWTSCDREWRGTSLWYLLCPSASCLGQFQRGCRLSAARVMLCSNKQPIPTSYQQSSSDLLQFSACSSPTCGWHLAGHARGCSVSPRCSQMPVSCFSF